MKNFIKQNVYLILGFMFLLIVLIIILKDFLKDISGSIKSGFDSKNVVLPNPIVLNSSGSSLNDKQASLIADRIYHAMSYYGTDEVELLKQLNLSLIHI